MPGSTSQQSKSQQSNALTAPSRTSATEPVIDVYYTPQEVAGRCGLSRRRIYDWLAWGWLRGLRRGGRWVVAADDWEFFTRTCRGARGRLMPSLRDWEPLWNSRPLLLTAPDL